MTLNAYRRLAWNPSPLYLPEYELTIFGKVTVRKSERSHAHTDPLTSGTDLMTELATEASVDATCFDEATIHHATGSRCVTVVEVFIDATERRMLNPSFSLMFSCFLSEEEVLSDSDVAALVRFEVLTELAAFNQPTVETYLRAGIDLDEIGDDCPFSFDLVNRPTGRSLRLLDGDDRNDMAIVESDTGAAIE